MNNYSQARTNMVDGQIHPAGVTTPEILNAFETVEREIFVPKHIRNIAYCDSDLPITEERFLLEPITHAKMVEAISPQKDDIVLDIGGTTGYSAAILSSMVSTVIALENSELLLSQAQIHWNAMNACNIVGIMGELPFGNARNAQYNTIFINGAVAEIPQNIVDQLALNGKLITIVKQSGTPLGDVTLVQKLAEGEYATKKLFSAGADYLPGFEPKESFTL